MNVAPIREIALAEPFRLPGETNASGDFQRTLAGAIERVDGFRHDARASLGRFLAGEGEELHAVALAAQRAELAFELGLQVRNKVIQAYQEIMRMQI
ncbi:MAG: flagellar hook-basal body complex protein FliE [Acidobacteria bacterium]|nr:flagellar hook-basal body complex protein FliE [Acidobacteriota bacterium]